MNREDAKAILEPYVQRLYDALKRAWAKVQEELDADPERRLTYDSSSVAALVYCWFVRYVEQEFADSKPGTITKNWAHDQDSP